MKKIVGILSAAAVLATSVFAADVSAKVKLTGSLFNFDTDGNKISALTLNYHQSHNWEPDMALAYADEKSGAEIKFKTLNEWWNGEGETSTAWKIWFSPIEALKFTIGTWDSNLNQEHIDWSNTASGIGTAGYTLTLAPIAGLTVDLTFAPNWGNPWFATADDADAALGELGLLVHYGADFGTISAMFDAKDTFKTLKFGAGYANTFAPVSMFVNVLGFVNEANGFEKVRAELYGEASIDALKFSLFLPVDVNVYDGAQDAVEVGALFRFDYYLNGYDIFVYVKDLDLIASPFSMIIQPGVEFNVGACHIKCSVEVKAQEKIAIGVPVEFTVDF